MTASTPTLRQWIREHDESWIFVVVYLGMAVGLSVFVSLFWLVVVALLHFLLELIRQSHYRVGARSVGLHALWEVKLDVGLVLLALTLVLYIDVVLGILGIQSAARAAGVTRAGARVATRAAAWERNLRTFLLTVDEMARVTHAGVVFWRKGREKTGKKGNQGSGESEIQGEEESIPEDGGAPEDSPAEAEASKIPEAPEPSTLPAEPPPPPAWQERWGIGDRIGMGLVAASILLILAAPLFTPYDWSTAMSALMEELRPFPS